MNKFIRIGLLFFGGVSAAVGIGAVTGVLDIPLPFTDNAPKVVVGSEVAGEQQQEIASLTEKSSPAAEPAPVENKVYPTFDVLRVEPDGATLIAGKAAAGATIEILDGQQVVATTSAGSEGDFVALTEKNLTVGDHSLSIRATDGQNQVLTSLETGVVSIPQQKSGDLLVMIVKQGEASRILQQTTNDATGKAAEAETVPETIPAPVDVAKNIAATEPDPEAEVEIAMAPANADAASKSTSQQPPAISPSATTAKPTESPEAAASETSQAEQAPVREMAAGADKAADPTVEPAKAAEPDQTVASKPQSTSEQSPPTATTAKPTESPEAAASETSQAEQAPAREMAAGSDKATDPTVEPAKAVEPDQTVASKPQSISEQSPPIASKAASEPVATESAPDSATAKTTTEPAKPVAAESAPDSTTAKTTTEPAKPESSETVVAKTAVPAAQEASGQTATPPEKIAETSKSPATEQPAESTAPVVAESTDTAQKPETTTQPASDAPPPAAEEEPPTVVVEAVEVEDGRMFIAGAAKPGRRIAIYLDNELLGFSTGTAKGRFLLEIERDLAPGNYLVRADIFDRSGDNVAGRAEVPLIHQPEPVVVARVEEPPKPQTAKSLDPDEPVENEMTGNDEQPPEVKVEKPATKPVEIASAEQPKKSPPPSPAVTKAVEQPVDVTPEAPAKTAPKSATQVEAPEVKSTDTMPAKPETAMAKPAEKPASSTSENTDASPTPPVAKKPPPVEQTTQPATPKATTLASAQAEAPSLILRTGSSVIIRHGDNLWRISYRTYGRGIRYSTIYQANLDQLRSPHKIYPGQILKVPKMNFDQQG